MSQPNTRLSASDRAAKLMHDTVLAVHEVDPDACTYLLHQLGDDLVGRINVLVDHDLATGLANALRARIEHSFDTTPASPHPEDGFDDEPDYDELTEDEQREQDWLAVMPRIGWDGELVGWDGRPL
ncbi:MULTISPECIES: hypothetical protein [Actinosynnema]|uniref:hypothetical protein n=1 Tax=Actinosynnema TaxID=40566 RepID=UPI0020A5F4F4|nr:hypothetical protein [Actinosynnema pretiosum]MCP2097493.1 hypothetical protein [Actinosynnema pretiosum]